MSEYAVNPETTDVLVVKRLFSASIERVFDAWTKAEVLAKWFGPEGFLVSRSEVDLRVGGEYEIEINSPDGNCIRHFGHYVEILKPSKLVFTWMLEDQSCKGSEGLCAETLVSIEFKCIEQATEITLTHERLPNKEAYDGHQFGWNSSLDSLATYLTTEK
jgi:uncharacterized protein YndB with AHSA1/START domain